MDWPGSAKDPMLVSRKWELEERERKWSLVALPALIVGLGLVIAVLARDLNRWFAVGGAVLMAFGAIALIIVDRLRKTIDGLELEEQTLQSPIATDIDLMQRRAAAPSKWQQQEAAAEALRKESQDRARRRSGG